MEKLKNIQDQLSYNHSSKLLEYSLLRLSDSILIDTKSFFKVGV